MSVPGPRGATMYRVIVVIGIAIALIAAITVGVRTGYIVDRRLALIVCYAVIVVGATLCLWFIFGRSIAANDERVRKHVIANMDTAQYPIVPTQGGLYQAPHQLDDGLSMRMLAELSRPPRIDDIP